VILCIDIGNTSTKMARVANRDVHDRMSRPRDATDEQVARLIRRVARDGIDGAAIASVRPQATAAVRAIIKRDLGVAPLVVTSRVKLPFEIATRRPARVGVDRLCAAAGAVAADRSPGAIVADAGSAITVDLVVDGRFLGGLIMAGPQMMLGALHRDTAQLPSLRLGARGAGEIDDTVPAMLTGAVVATVGAIERGVKVLEGRAGRRLPVYLTGGHSHVLSSMLPDGWILSPDLTLEGLAAIARLNR
jgi:type III pantothenate kinase